VVKQTKKNIGMHLDLGAGTGSFVHAMERHGWNTIGFEPIERARKLANRLFKASIYPLEDFFQIPVAGGYDAITLWHTLEHVYHLHPTFERLSKLLSKNGKLFIAVPNYTSYDASYYKENWAAYDVPRHLYHFSPQSIQYLAQKYQLKVVSIKPLWFDSTYISLMSERYRKGFVLFGFVIGFISNWITLFNKKRCSSILYILQKEIIEEEI
jgi:2-polyprenyl-3-methyl-5-hydroxy-6-metoxy-1,4-benzoquinol methylase